MVCILYYTTGTGMIVPYITDRAGERLSARWGHAAAAYFVWLVALFCIFLLLWLGLSCVNQWLGPAQSPRTDFCFRVVYRLVVFLLLAELLRKFANWFWRKDKGEGSAEGASHDKTETRAGLWHGLDVLFDPHGHLFPLLGILGTFLGLGMAIPDRGLLDIIGHLNEGGGISAEKWSELIAGIGVAVFASLHGTFSILFAQFFAGYFGKGAGEPECVCPEGEKPSHGPTNSETRGVGATDESESVIDTSSSVSRTHPDDRNEFQRKTLQALTDLQAGLRSNSSDMQEMESKLTPLEDVLPQIQKTMDTIGTREAEFAAIRAELASIISRLNAEPLSLLSSMDETLKRKNEEARQLLDQVRVDLGAQAGTVSERANAISASLMRLNNLLNELGQGQWVKANSDLMAQMNVLMREFEDLSRKVTPGPTAEDIRGAVDQAQKPLVDAVKDLLSRLANPKSKKGKRR